MKRRPRPAPSRAPRLVRPACEPLEGRALLAGSALDPSFGTGGVVLGPPASNPSDATTTGTVVAVAVQGDGKIVALVDVPPKNGASSTPTPTAQRFNADGSVDATFGTGGQVVLPFFAGGLALTAGGQIVVTGSTSTSTTDASGATTSTEQDSVARLTAAGALDTTFGTGGISSLPAAFTGISAPVVEGNGRIVVAAEVAGNTGGNTLAYPEAVVLGLTPAGAPDAAFGTGGRVALPDATITPPQFYTVGAVDLAGLHLTPSGQILLGVTTGLLQPIFSGLSTPPRGATLTRLDADGTIDTTFGTGGTVGEATLGSGATYADFAVQPDGRIVLVGASSQNFAQAQPAVIRLTTAGALDPTFTTPYLGLVPPGAGFQSVVVDPDGTITALQQGGLVQRFTATGALDTTFGRGGQIAVAVPRSLLPSGTTTIFATYRALALSASGDLLLGGNITGSGADGNSANPTVAQSVLARVLPIRLPQVVNDYDGDGRSDLALQLGAFGAFAYRHSNNFGDDVEPFGIPGEGQTIPAPGDYDGDGKTDIAAYLPSLGILAYRPSGGGPDVYLRFGPTGTGTSVAVPVPGDYDGDGRTDFALYLPASSTFIVDPSSGAAPYAVAFGPAGLGAAIPAPGDYDGDGRTDFALYLPGSGAFAIDPSGGAAPYAVSFGAPGQDQTIPAPGDYDGDGRTDIAAYLPGYSTYAYRPSGGGADVLARFGPGFAATPAPGDYDGDGLSDIALYLPGNSVFAIDPSGGAAPSAQQFGNADPGITVPATTVVIPIAASGSGNNAIPGAIGSVAAASVPNYLPDDLPGVPSAPKKRKV